MRRLTLALLLGAAALLPVMAQNGVLSESFSSWPPGGWSLPPTAAGERWEASESAETANYTGGEGRCAAAHPFSGGDLDLLTPPFALPPGATGARLRFREDLLLREGSGEAAQIALSTDGGATFPILLLRREAGGAVVRGPSETTVDLSPWAGGSGLVLRFRFEARSEPHGWWQVDDVRVEAPGCGTQRPTLAGPSFACGPGVLLQAGEGWATYRWYRDGLLLTGATGRELFAGLSGTYEVVGRGPEGCEGRSDPLSVTVEAPAPPSVEGPFEGCPGQAVVLTARGPSGASCRWYRDGLPLEGVSGPSLTVTEGGAYQAALQGPGGCTAFSPAHTVVFPASPPTPAVVSASCDRWVLEAPPGLASWNWTRDGQPLPGASGSTLAAEESGAYAVAGLSPRGCALTSPPVAVALAPRPQAAVSPDACPGGVFLEAGGATGVLRWEYGGRELPGAAASPLATTLPGRYTAVVEDGTGCGRRSLPVDVEVPPCSSREVSGSGDFFPFTLEKVLLKEGSPAVRLTFQKAAGAVSYALFWGTLDRPGSHTEPGHALCGLAPADDGSGRLEVTVADLPDNAYFLLSADLGGVLSVAGRDSAGNPLPPGSCSP